MLILHAAWLTPAGKTPAQFTVWGEADYPSARRPDGTLDTSLARRASGSGGRPRRIPTHPFGASPELLWAHLPLPDPAGQASDVLVRLPTRGGAPLPSRPFLGGAGGRGRGPVTPQTWRTPALGFAPPDALAQLINLAEEPAPGVDYGPDLAFWRAALDAARDRERFDQLAAAMPPAARAGARSCSRPPVSACASGSDQSPPTRPRRAAWRA
jgi:hypothetical protein